MKKSFLLTLILLGSLTFTACGNETKPIDNLVKDVAITYAEGENKNNVKNNFTVPLTVGDATISWVSNSPLITFSGANGLVTRADDTRSVQVTATVTLGSDTRDKIFGLTILPKEFTDTIAPVISGVNDFNLAVNSIAPNWLQGVTATDDIDGIVPVAVNATAVKLDTIGNYTIIYSASDVAGNTSNVNATVRVKDASDLYDKISDVLQMTTGSTATIRGVVTGLVGNESYAIRDSSGTIGLYNGASLTLTSGKEYVIRGTRGQYMGLNQLSPATIVETIGDASIGEPLNIDAMGVGAEALEELQCRLISVSSLRILSKTTDANGNYTIRVQDPNGTEIDLRADSRLPGFSSFSSKLSGLVVNGIYDFVGHVGWFNTAQLIFDAGSSLTDSTIDPGTDVTTPIATVHLKVKENVQVRTSGTVSRSYKNSTNVIFFIQDGVSGIKCTAVIGFDSSVVPHTNILVTGTRATIDGEVTIKDVTVISKVSDQTAPYREVFADNIYDRKNSLVLITGLLSAKYVSGSSLTLYSSHGNITIELPNNLSASDLDGIGSKLLSIDVTDTVSVIGIASIKNGTEYVLLVSASDVSKTSTSSGSLASVIISYLKFPANDSKVVTNIDLPTAGLFGSTITWSSSNTSVLTNTGVFTAPDEDVTITLSYTVKDNNSATLSTGSITLYALAGGATYSGTYYDGIDFGLSSSALKSAIKTLISAKTLKTYGESRYILDKSDVDPSNPNNVILMYNRASVRGAWDGGASWNREHVYPQSFLGVSASNEVANMASDLQNLKPANASINSSRGNKPFADKPGGGSHGAVSGGYYPGDEDRGDVARSILYMNTCWDLNIANVGTLATLIQWHYADPVDEFEIYRNEYISAQQKNRNPYIDMPSLVGTIFG